MNLLIHPSLPPSYSDLMAGEPSWSPVHWAEVGTPDTTDKEFFAYAAMHGSTVVSADLGLRRILTACPEGTPSVLQVRGERLDPELTGRHVFAAIKQMESELNAGALVTLTVASTGNRIRVLPIVRNPLQNAQAEGLVFSRDAFLPSALLTRPEWPEPVQMLAKLCIGINRLSVMRLQDIQFRTNDGSAIVSALLLSQATTGFEASCILASTGMEGEARAQARNSLEAAIVGYALAAKPELDVIAKLNGAHKRHYVTWLQALREGIGLREGEPLEAYIQRIIQDSDAFPTGSIKLEQLAKDAGIGDVYAVLYRYLSAEAGHPTWDSLSKSATRNAAGGQVVGISVRPRFERIGETLAIAAQCQLMALKGLQIAFPDRDIDDMVELYIDALRHLATLPLPQTLREAIG